MAHHSPKDGGLRPISSATPKIEGSTRTPKPTPSSTTGGPKADSAPPSATGQPPSAHGAVAVPPRALSAQTALRLLGLPDAAVGLMPSLAASLAWSTRSVTGTDGQFERAELADVSVRKGVPLVRLQDLLRQLDNLDKPCGATVAGRALVELRALTAARPDSDISTELQATAYTARLARYPADAVETACADWPSQSTWWPSWHELQRAVERRSAPRALMRDALRRHIERAAP
jgi:hypothetical protein